MREMPIGEQSFEKLRNNQQVYVDKTALVYKLAKSNNPFFLTRPRRFGKSLLISTLEAYFKGKSGLFEGLAIADLEQDWIEYPVIHIDLSGANYKKHSDIEIALDAKLKPYEEQYEIKQKAASAALRFEELIRKASEKTGKGVVVLIDEYDKPLLESLDNVELNNYYRDILRAFYGVLKGASQYLRFTLLTGVTKFSKVSVFSDLNHLRDISLVNDYSAICGITHNELVDTFAPEIKDLAAELDIAYDDALAQLKQQYNGYHFSKKGVDVYNPFSVLNTFANREFGNYWYATGTPTFLFKLIEQSNFDIIEFQSGIVIDVNHIDDFRIGSTNPVPVLYQSGYLTVKRYIEDDNAFELGFPNAEVEFGFLKELLPTLMEQPNPDANFDARNFKNDLTASNIDAFMTRLKALFASVPYGIAQRNEHYYQSIFYLVFTLMGQFVKVEEHTYKGRSDAVVQTKDSVFVFEFKLESGDGDGAASKALEQIDNKGYAELYAASDKQLYKIGVQFDPEARNITNYIVNT
jgi:hypothetical protein